MRKIVHTMPRIVSTIERAARWLVLKMGLLGGLAILIIMVSTLVEVISRYVFNSPTAWSLPLNVYTLVAVACLSAGYTWSKGGHIKVDIVYREWSAPTRAKVNIATMTLGLGFLIVLIVGSWELTMVNLHKGGTMMAGTTMWPLWPDQILVPIGASVLLIQALVIIFLSFNQLRRRL